MVAVALGASDTTRFSILGSSGVGDLNIGILPPAESHRYTFDIPSAVFESFTLAAAVDSLAGLSTQLGPADAIEFRMDLAENPLDQLRQFDGTLPIIATNRAKWEGGKASDKGRLDQLADAMSIPAVAAIDVELAAISDGTATRVLETAATQNVDVIASWHDFESTPSKTTMRRRLIEGSEHADIAKIAVMASHIGDVLPLLQVTHELSDRGIPVATMSMGEAGRHSRVVAPLYGSRIGYAPPSDQGATAPGQFELGRMAELIDTLR